MNDIRKGLTANVQITPEFCKNVRDRKILQKNFSKIVVRLESALLSGFRKHFCV